MKRLIAACFSIVMVLTLCLPASAAVVAENWMVPVCEEPVDEMGGARIIGSGTITGNYVNVRSGPSTSYSVIAQVNKGDKVGVWSFTKDENSSDPDDIWYYCIVSSTKQKGYIYGAYVSVNPE